MKRGSFGMPKRGNLRKKTDADEGEDAGAGAEEAPAIVIPPEKTKSKKGEGQGRRRDGRVAAELRRRGGRRRHFPGNKEAAGRGRRAPRQEEVDARARRLEARRRGEKGRRGVLDRAAARARQRAKTLTARPAEHMDHNAPANGRSGAGTREPIAFMPPPPRPGRDDDFGIPDAAAIKAAKAKREAARAALTSAADHTPVPGAEVDVDMDAGEDTAWEDEQLRKAMSAGAAAGAPRAVVKKQPSVDVLAGGRAALESLRNGVARLEVSRQNAKNEVTRADAALASSEATLKNHEERLTAAGERYKYMQEMRDYFRDLCECLREKGPIIDELEEHAQRLHEHRGLASKRESEGNLRDEATEAEAGMEAAQGALMRGASQAEAIAAATAAAEGAIAARFDSLRPNLDEFGRDLNLAERQAAEKRAVVRRSRREEELSMKNLGEEDDVEDAVEVGVFTRAWKTRPRLRRK